MMKLKKTYDRQCAGESSRLRRGWGRLLCGLFLLFVSALPTSGQRFFNLTAEQVKIDSVLPHFTYSVPLFDNFADSTYTVEIKYPEYFEMGKRDYQRYLALTGEPPKEKPVVSWQVVVNRKKGELEFSFLPIVMHDGKPQFLVSFMAQVNSYPVKRSLRRQNVRRASERQSRYASHSVLAEGSWAKIRVPADGIYQLSSSLIRQAGFSDPGRVKIYGYGGHLLNEQLVGSELAEEDDLKELPTCTVNGRRLFYGHGPVSWSSNDADRRTRNPYSDYGYYFLTESDGEPLSIDSTTFAADYGNQPVDYHSLHEVDNFAWFHGGRNLFEDSPISVGTSKIYTLTNSAHSSEGKLSVCVTAGVASKVSVELNGKPLGEMSISLGSYDSGNSRTETYQVDQLLPVDTVTIKTLSGGPVRLDYVSMAYHTPRPMPSLSTTPFAEPEYVYNITNQDLHSHGPADMVIIIPTSQKLRQQAQRLADYHAEHDKLRVTIVPADELFNEFSSGTPDASAYRRYMKMLYDRAESDDDMPKYLLLFGDCLWDNRLLLPETKSYDADDLLLSFESENSFSETDCYVDDGFYALLDDGEGLNPISSDKLDLAVGRIPVLTESAAQSVVDKQIAYMENKNAGDWQNVVMFMGDDGDNNVHMSDVNNTADQIGVLHPGYHIKKVMWDAYKRETSSTGYTYPEVSDIIKQQQQAGALVMDYGGHGSTLQISHESVLRITDFQTFSNTNLPLWVTASCDIMPFDGVKPTNGEEALLNKKGGAVAFYGTTRTVYANKNRVINTSFLKHVLNVVDGKPVAVGEASRLAKNEMISTGQDLTANKLQYSLLGDPALTLHVPTLNIVIDSVAGVSTQSADLPVLKAGSTAVVKGHIEQGGSKAESFQGKMTATVRDTRELIVCRKNDEALVNAFSFYDRQKVLYNGSDSVRNGEFSFIFAVPRDINYANGTGLINVYAVSNDRKLTAHGSDENFYINGSEAIVNDSIGPSLYCYLNSPSFVNGGNVNTTPYFVAQISDKDGINASGSGIGHDLELIVDGAMSKTYNLNNNFTYDFGSYTSGSTYYHIPELEPGMHTLKFRAWDILNNSSTAELSFNVVKSLQPEITSISCTNNPAKTSTTFIVNHNFTGANVDVIIDVFDMGGRLLWQHEESGISTGSAYTVNWDLTVDSGARLQTGVYLYRVRLGSNGSSKSSKAKKLIVIQ